VQDITEQRRAQEALRESEERWRLAAQAGRMYAYEWDRESDLITRSAEYARVLGFASEGENSTGQQTLNMVHPEDRINITSATDRCTPENPTYRIRYRVVRPDGSIIWLENHARACFDATRRMLRMIGMVADITEQKLAEEALS